MKVCGANPIRVGPTSRYIVPYPRFGLLRRLAVYVTVGVVDFFVLALTELAVSQVGFRDPRPLESAIISIEGLLMATIFGATVLWVNSRARSLWRAFFPLALILVSPLLCEMVMDALSLQPELFPGTLRPPVTWASQLAMMLATTPLILVLLAHWLRLGHGHWRQVDRNYGEELARWLSLGGAISVAGIVPALYARYGARQGWPSWVVIMALTLFAASWLRPRLRGAVQFVWSWDDTGFRGSLRKWGRRWRAAWRAEEDRLEAQHWWDGYEHLCKYRDEAGTALVPRGWKVDTSYPAKQASFYLADWVQTQRRLKRQHRLALWKVALLKQLSGWDWRDRWADRRGGASAQRPAGGVDVIASDAAGVSTPRCQRPPASWVGTGAIARGPDG